MGAKVNLLELERPELARLLREWDEPAFRAGQIWQWIYRGLVTDFEAMTNLPVPLRQKLASRAELTAGRQIEQLVSEDKLTRKALLELSDHSSVECVLMLYERRRSGCVSTQLGCPICCSFCATGQSGFERDLTVGEIVFQALHLARLARPSAGDAEHPLTNVVYMGMGEPLLNYDATWASVVRLTDPEGFAMGSRRITISTAGVVPGIRRLAGESLQVGLAVSLHAPDDALRSKLVPLNRRYPLADLMEAVRFYVLQTGRRVTFEYALIDEVNDDRALAHDVANLLAGIPAHVNLIPVNPAEGSSVRPSPRGRVEGFAQALEQRGVPVTIRLRRGIDVQAGCGQLRRRQQGE